MGWVESWRGEAVAWECDELGHLNMRHYVGKAREARQFLFIHLGLHHSFRLGAPSGVHAKTVETCYLREARPGARLSIRSGVTRLGEADAEVLHVMEHADGSRAATIRETVVHVARRTGEAFAWPRRLREAVGLVDGSDAKPRGLPEGTVPAAPDRALLEKLGASRVGAGVFRADEADVFGRILPHSVQGRVSESVGNFREGWPEAYGPDGSYNPEREGAARLSGVLLEMRMHIHRAGQAGMAFEVWSAVAGAEPMTRQLQHHVVDPVSGRPYAGFEATSAIIDLQARRLVRASDDVVEDLRARVVEGLSV